MGSLTLDCVRGHEYSMLLLHDSTNDVHADNNDDKKRKTPGTDGNRRTSHILRQQYRGEQPW